MPLQPERAVVRHAEHDSLQQGPRQMRAQHNLMFVQAADNPSYYAGKKTIHPGFEALPDTKLLASHLDIYLSQH